MSLFSGLAAHFLPQQSGQSFAAVAPSGVFDFFRTTNTHIVAQHNEGLSPVVVGQAKAHFLDQAHGLSGFLKVDQRSALLRENNLNIFSCADNKAVQDFSNALFWPTLRPWPKHRRALVQVGFKVAAAAVARDRTLFPSQSRILVQLQHEWIDQARGRYRGAAGQWHRDSLQEDERDLPDEKQPRLWAWRSAMGLVAVSEADARGAPSGQINDGWKPEQIQHTTDGALLLLKCGANGTIHASRPCQPGKAPVASVMVNIEILP